MSCPRGRPTRGTSDGPSGQHSVTCSCASYSTGWTSWTDSSPIREPPGSCRPQARLGVVAPATSSLSELEGQPGELLGEGPQAPLDGQVVGLRAGDDQAGVPGSLAEAVGAVVLAAEHCGVGGGPQRGQCAHGRVLGEQGRDDGLEQADGGG